MTRMGHSVMTASRPEGLVVSHLVKRYGAVTAVDDVSFTVAPGEFISLLGPSGCGKTTTLRCIAGFERADRGAISIDGEVVTDAASGVFVPPNKRNFGMVFQSYAIWPHMSVLDNVGYPLRVQKKYARSAIRERVLDKLGTVGLAGLEGRYPTQLSGGQQQRVAVARALIMEPKVLLFDGDEQPRDRDGGRPDRPGGPARAYLRPSEEPLRRRLHRPQQLRPGGGSRPRGRRPVARAKPARPALVHG
jgi:ABC-type Fe3+/spermidine/putrescine transport system ATPase subunit